MIEFLKKNKVLSYITLSYLILTIIVSILAVVPANKDIISPGGLNTVESVIEVNNESKLEGSFNTVYVYSMERVSILQSLDESVISLLEDNIATSDCNIDTLSIL